MTAVVFGMARALVKLTGRSNGHWERRTDAGELSRSVINVDLRVDYGDWKHRHGFCRTTRCGH